MRRIEKESLSPSLLSTMAVNRRAHFRRKFRGIIPAPEVYDCDLKARNTGPEHLSFSRKLENRSRGSGHLLGFEQGQDSDPIGACHKVATGQVVDTVITHKCDAGHYHTTCQSISIRTGP